MWFTLIFNACKLVYTINWLLTRYHNEFCECINHNAFFIGHVGSLYGLAFDAVASELYYSYQTNVGVVTLNGTRDISKDTHKLRNIAVDPVHR